jgi:outer membrane protein OmpA-like peptidoglycan-associated protein
MKTQTMQNKRLSKGLQMHYFKRVQSIIFFICFFLIKSFLYSQSKIYVDSTYHEDFSSPSSEWSQFQDSLRTARIIDGRYEIQTMGKGIFVDKRLILDQSLDYSFECVFDQLSFGNPGQYFGFIFGFKNTRSLNWFSFNSGRTFSIFTRDGHKSKYLRKNRLMESFNYKGLNNLKIEKKNEMYFFFINDKVVYKCKQKKIKSKGDFICLYVSDRMSVNINEIIVKGFIKPINLIKDPIKGYQKINLGSSINSKHCELAPVIAPDGNTLYFIKEFNPNDNEDKMQHVWYSERIGENSWSEAKYANFPLNIDHVSTGVISVSADNNTLFVYNEDDTFKGNVISKTSRTTDGWEIPTKITIRNYYNNNQYENFFISQDKMFLLMNVERYDSFGDLDIYVSFLQSDGTYSKPMNLGNIINSTGSEGTPFLGSDNKTLYFSSDGHPGYGSTDIFVTTRLDDTWQNWTEPQNLGPEINSKDWDAYFTLPASGDIAYMVTAENSLGNEDIVVIKMPEAAQPDPVVLIKGKVYNQKTGLPLEAKIFYYEAESGIEVGDAISHPTGGDYSIILQYGTRYSFRAEKTGFYAINDFIDLTDVMEYQEIERDLFLVPVEVGQVVRLNNIFFDYDKAELKQDSYDELNRLAKFLNDNPQMEIEIGGHTDYIGTDEYNKDLSLRRVKSVVGYLSNKGISNPRLKAVGYGKAKPIDTNETEEGRAKNRRVEFTILKQ